MSRDIPFAHSLVITCSPLANQPQQQAKITLLDGEASVSGVPLHIYGTPHLVQPHGATIVDCTNIRGCRIDISSSSSFSSSSSSPLSSSNRIHTKLVPHASCLLDGGLIRRVREARALAKQGQGESPRVLILSTCAAGTRCGGDDDGAAGAGLSRWATESLVKSASSYPGFSFSGASSSSTAASSASASTASVTCSAVLDLSLDPLVSCKTNSASQQKQQQQQQGGSCSLKFYSSSPSSGTTMEVMERYNFFVGTSPTTKPDEARGEKLQQLEQALLEVASTCNEMFTYVTGSSFEFNSSGLVVNLGEISFDYCYGGGDKSTDTVTASMASASSSPSLQLMQSLLPKLVRQLRVTHIGLLLSSACHAGGENQKVVELVRSATDSVVRGVSVEVVRVPFFSSSTPTPNSGASSRWISSSAASSPSSSSSSAAVFSVLQQYFAHGRRIVVETSNLDLRDALTFKLLSSQQASSSPSTTTTTTKLKLYSLCGVCAPQPNETSTTNSGASPLSPASKRLVVGYVVIVEIGPSCLVVLTPSFVSTNSLPSRTLLVSSDIIVHPQYLPSIVETY